MAARVVKSLLPIRSITRRPRLASNRSVRTETEPSGKARRAATDRRSGVEDVMASDLRS